MSLRVVHTFGRNAGAAVVLDRPLIRFGRAPDNDVVFDPNFDRDASSHHAEVRREGEAWVLHDLDSRNGLFVNGRRVTRQALAPGDEVMFGAKGPRVRIELLVAPAHAHRPPSAAPRTEAMPAVAPQPSAVVAPPVAAAPPAGAAPAAPPAPQPFTAFSASPQPHAPAFSAAPLPDVPALVSHQPHQPRAADAAPPAPMQAPPAGSRRIGQRTMAVMIDSAVSAATGRARPRRTVEINAMVDQQVQVATSGHRRATYALAALLLVAFACLGGIIVYNRASHSDIARLREDLARLAPEDPRRKEIERRLGTLHPSNANFGRNLYEHRKKGIFMLASSGSGFCSAFAVKPSVLATNAHCIHVARRRGGSVVAVENEGRGQVSFPVAEMRAHPGYRDGDPNSITPDVAVVKISGRAAVVLELAAAAELGAAGAGDDIYLIGFPGRLMDAANPAATFLAANIGRITGAAGRPAPAAEAWLIQHDASTTDGMNGSPIFNGHGKVIAVNAGSYLDSDDETIAGRKTEVVKASPYKFGMRVDLLDPLLR